MTRLVLRPAAEADINAAADYYAQEENVELGLRFYDAVDRTLAAPLEQPHLGVVQESLFGRLAACRRWSVAKPFAVHQMFYLPSETTLEVVRVLHGGRDTLGILSEADQ